MLEVGDKVKMTGRYYVRNKKNLEKVFTVKTSPRTINGVSTVQLENYHGCYAVDGLVKV